MASNRNETEMWELERVYTHRSEDRTTHHVEARDEQHAKQRLSQLEERGETDDRGNEIESQPGNPLHVHVHRTWDTESE